MKTLRIVLALVATWAIVAGPARLRAADGPYKQASGGEGGWD